jgi:ssDNA-binding Zn-finger/Zn-ribbon topoisomerase 1
MISQNPYSNCMSARLYYYDFLSEENKEGIPESTLNHILNCPDCRAEIKRLEAILANLDEKVEDQQSQRNSAITCLLKLHFAYVDEPVTCSMVKPFLASLADPVLQLLIPTPITKHIDECRNCRTDLHTLKNLHLTHKQLCRLGQLVAEERPTNGVSCAEAREAIPTVASMAFKQTNADILRHLSTCPDCRKELSRHREELRQNLPSDGKGNDTIPCQAVLPSDVYDYALPYGIDPANDEYAKFRAPLASHVSGCPACLAKIQNLQRTIYDITERPESDVVTVYNLEEPALPGAEVRGDRTRPVRRINFTAARLKQAAWSPAVRPWLKAGIAAALVLAAWMLIPPGPTVEAVSLSQMDAAIQKARNIHTETYWGDETKPRQEQWASRLLQRLLFRNEENVVLSDYANGYRKERQGHNGPIEKKSMPDSTYDGIERNMAVFLNILPASAEHLSKKSSWSRAPDIEPGPDSRSGEVYELALTETTGNGSLLFYKRIFYVDPKTNLPYKVEVFRKSSEADDYTFQSRTFVEEISDDKMQADIENVFPEDF